MAFHLVQSLLTPGHFRSAWRLPHADPFAYLDIDHFRRLARIAEEATIDAVFLGDGPALRGEIAHAPDTGLDPLILLTALAGATERLGLVATTSTTYNSPYNVARRFNALDHVTKGRAGVNVVTTLSAAAAANFGLAEHPDKTTRYRRAREFLSVVTQLWDAWEPGALLGDKPSGRYADRDLIHDIDHVGEFFSVRGPLPVPASPQGRPVVVQAGGSDGGLALAAEFADLVFTVAHTRGKAIAFRDGIRARAAASGRDPGDVKVSLGVVVLVASTEAEAARREHELNESLPIEPLAAQVAASLGLPPGRFGPDDAIRAADLPELPLGEIGSVGFQVSTRALIAEGPVTLRELVHRSAGGAGHRLLVGTPESVANDLETWWRAGAADGFTIMPADTAVDFENVAREVVPVLQRRGLFHQDYPEGTLRDRLGLGYHPGSGGPAAQRPWLATAAAASAAASGSR